MPNDEVQKWCKRHCHPGAYCPDGYCIEALEAVKPKARVKRSLPPAPEPTKPPEKTDKDTVRAIEEIRYELSTKLIKQQNLRKGHK